MANMIDYLKWRGDLSFDVVPFGEVDQLICSRIAYLPFDGLLTSSFEDEHSLAELIQAYKAMPADIRKRLLMENDGRLMDVLAESERYKHILICGFVNEVDNEQDIQFSAMTLKIFSNLHCIAFRGTDNTITGWREDFMMTFQNEIPSQLLALDYVKKACEVIPSYLVLCGHSKGGNLADYCMTHVPEEIENRILKAYNNDGPDCSDGVTHEKMVKYLPQASLFGLLYAHEDFNIIQSDGNGLYQHDPYTWQVMGNKLLTADELTVTSQFMEDQIQDWLKEIPPEQKEKFFTTLFDLFDSTDAETMSEVGRKKKMALVRYFAALDKESKQIILDTIGAMSSSFFKNSEQMIKKILNLSHDESKASKNK